MPAEVLPDRCPNRAGTVAGYDLDVQRSGGPLLAQEPIQLQQRLVDAEPVQVQPRIVVGSTPACCHGRPQV